MNTTAIRLLPRVEEVHFPVLDVDHADPIAGAELGEGFAPVLVANAISTVELAAEAVTAEKLAAIELQVGKYIRSSNYAAGATGWAIDGAGNAEFNDVVIRGTLDGADGVFAGGLSGGVIHVSGTLSLDGSTPPNDVPVPNGAAVIQWGGEGTLSGARIIRRTTPKNAIVLQFKPLSGDWQDVFIFNADGTTS